MTRTQLFEWISVAVLLVGCALATAGVMAIVLDSAIAAVLVVIGAAVAVVGALAWTAVVKAGSRRRASS